MAFALRLLINISTLQSVCEQFPLSPGVFVHVNKMDLFFEGSHFALPSLKSHKIQYCTSGLDTWGTAYVD